MPVAKPIIRFCAGKARFTALKASRLIRLTNMLSTMLYSACTSIEMMMGSDIVTTSLPTGITPILFSATLFSCMYLSCEFL